MVTDSPETVLEFMDRFHAEEQCEEYLLKLRFPEGFCCRRCAGKKAYRMGRRLECAACGKETSLTAGTVLHKTRTPLRIWFWAAFMFSRSKQGISANELSRQAGIRQEDAWLLLHKLRSHLDETRLLDGLVEADECLVGGVERASKGGRGSAGRSSKVKALVAVAVERRAYRRDGKLKTCAGRGRLQMIDAASEKILTAFAELAIAKGNLSRVRTDGWGGYNGLKRAGFRHERLVEGAPENGSSLFPWVHRLISNLKAWLHGTFRSVSKRYLPQYLQEFNFRLNRRRDEPSIFGRLLARAVNNPTVTLQDLQSQFRA